MSYNVPIGAGGVVDGMGAVSASSRGTTLGTGYTELIAATLFPYEGFWLNVHDGPATDQLIDVGIGGAGSEQTLIEDIYLCGVTSDGFQSAGQFFVPLKIPEGVRVAARSTAGCHATIQAANGGAGFMRGYAGCETYGVASGRGTTVTGSNSLNSKGGWGQITAATGFHIKALSACVGRNGNTALTDGDFLIDIGIGGSGSEQVLIPDLPFTVDSVRDLMAPKIFGPWTVEIPEGARLSARIAGSTTTAPDDDMDIVLYGFY